MSVNNEIDTSKPKELIKRHKGTITHYYHLSEFVYTKNCLSLWKKVKPLIQSCDKPFIYFDEKNHIICFVEGKNGEELQLEINDDELTYLDYPVLLSPLFFEKSFFESKTDADVVIDLYHLFKKIRE